LISAFQLFRFYPLVRHEEQGTRRRRIIAWSLWKSLVEETWQIRRRPRR
jgi:hypothetical protein